MKSAILALLALCAGQRAQAQTAVSFNPSNEACPTYCYGFKTDTAGYSVEWLNATYALTAPQHTLISVNGIVYSGTTTADAIGSAGTHSLYNVVGTLTGTDQSHLALQYVLEYWTTRVVSGRDAGHVVQHRQIDGGTFGVLPVQ